MLPAGPSFDLRSFVDDKGTAVAYGLMGFAVPFATVGLANVFVPAALTTF